MWVLGRRYERVADGIFLGSNDCEFLGRNSIVFSDWYSGVFYDDIVPPLPLIQVVLYFFLKL